MSADWDGNLTTLLGNQSPSQTASNLMSDIFSEHPTQDWSRYDDADNTINGPRMDYHKAPLNHDRDENRTPSKRQSRVDMTSSVFGTQDPRFEFLPANKNRNKPDSSSITLGTASGGPPREKSYCMIPSDDLELIRNMHFNMKNMQENIRELQGTKAELEQVKEKLQLIIRWTHDMAEVVGKTARQFFGKANIETRDTT